MSKWVYNHPMVCTPSEKMTLLPSIPERPFLLFPVLVLIPDLIRVAAFGRLLVFTGPTGSCIAT